MRVEPATSVDVGALAASWIALATEQRSHGSHLLAAENRDRIRESMAHHVAADTCLVARPSADDHPTNATEAESTGGTGADTPDFVGFVTFTESNEGYAMDATRGVVENLYVEPAWRNQGIGTDLLAAAERALAGRGVDTVRLEVLAANDHARRFYARAGYDDHRVVLERELDVETDTKPTDSR
jgi:ribosomal protein S18 acetylase RimI-like enzyme